MKAMSDNVGVPVYQTDVIVMGAGIAGLVAANRAAQLGLKVVVLEQGHEDQYLCNTRYTGGTFHLCMREITLDPSLLFDLIRDTTAGFVTEPLAQLLSKGGGRLIAWLQAEGIRFLRASASEYHKWVLAPPGRSRPGLDWEGRGGDVLLRTLESQLLKRAGQLQRGVKVESLLDQQGTCVGVQATAKGSVCQYHAKAVVIADGGFQCNPSLVRQYVSSQPAKLKQRNGGTAFGDGLLMAQKMGAAISGTAHFYGHVLSKDALTNDQLWPYPYLDALVTAGIVVNSSAQRFTDEGRGGVSVANAVAQLDDPLSAMCVFDEAIWKGPGKNGLIAANPHLVNEGATIFVAPTLQELALKAGWDPSVLQLTVKAYNEALVAAGASTLLMPSDGVPRHNKKYKPLPIQEGPFYAVPMASGITYTMGGIVINAQAQVLKQDGQVIEGLYAVGAATGGLEGGPQIGYVGGLAKGGITGLAAAEHVASQLGLAPPIR